MVPPYRAARTGFGRILFAACAWLAGLVGAWVFLGRENIDDVAFSESNCQSAAPDLIRLCQTEPGLLRHAAYGVDPAILPSLAKLHPKFVTIERDYANVMWGGGFQHAGWQLRRDPNSDPTARTNVWTLEFYGDGGRSPPRERPTFTMPTDARFKGAELTAATGPAGR